MEINKFNLEISKESERDYMKLSISDKTSVIRKLVTNYTSGNIRKASYLKGYKTIKRIKSGNFRIVILCNTKMDHKILMIGDRKEVYERIVRKGIRYK